MRLRDLVDILSFDLTVRIFYVIESNLLYQGTVDRIPISLSKCVVGKISPGDDGIDFNIEVMRWRLCHMDT